MKRRHPRHLLTALASAALLAACGGGGSDTTMAEAEAAFELSPTFQLAQALPPEPDDTDADGAGASALQAPGQVANASAAALSGSGLGAHVMAVSGNGEGRAGILATGSTTYYTPAQIRAAYGLNSLPGSAAYQGAGQTIAIVGAFHNADIARELSTFSQKYGLPACATLNIAATATLPLAKAGASCTISTVYATAAGAMTSKAPGTSAGWKTESSLDVEWAHAIAPLARIILVEAASASDSDMQGAILLAGKLGASVVSMSFGANEFAGQSSRDAKLFQASGVSYVASTGDKGRAVSWPAVSTQVLGVGGTTLAASGGNRSESGWSGSGGGISAYTAVPTWQAALKVTQTDGSVTAPRMRTLPDVAFNADPNSGQMLFTVNLNGSSGWVIAGGTSVAAPQWAGLLAVANAVRASAGKAPLGKLSSGFYRAITGNANTYNQSLYDVLTGKNGACKGCTAGSGYDLVTGLGSPKAPAVINQLVGL